MARTLLLSEDWDLTLTSNGRIALAPGRSGSAERDNAYATAQNVANAARLFLRDAYFDQERGIPHYNIALGLVPHESILKKRLRQAALSVEGVAEAVVTFDRAEGRVLGGNIQLTLTNGETAHVAL